MTGPARLSNPFIRKIECFVHITDDERALRHETSASAKAVKASAVLIEEGRKPSGTVLILDGMAYRYKIWANGRRQIMAYLIRGNLGDLDAALIGDMDHAIATFTDCRVVRLVPERLQRLQRHPDMALAFAWVPSWTRRPCVSGS